MHLGLLLLCTFLLSFVVLLVLLIEKSKVVRIFLLAIGSHRCSFSKLVVGALRQEEIGIADPTTHALLSP